jgi:hypothetical protein
MFNVMLLLTKEKKNLVRVFALEILRAYHHTILTKLETDIEGFIEPNIPEQETQDDFGTDEFNTDDFIEEDFDIDDSDVDDISDADFVVDEEDLS